MRRAERGVAVETRQAAPDDAGVGIQQETDLPVADQREVEARVQDRKSVV